MWYFWWGCRGNLNLITLESERVEPITNCIKWVLTTSDSSLNLLPFVQSVFPFQTWRQLWRVIEVSDVLLLITDVRHPVRKLWIHHATTPVSMWGPEVQVLSLHTPTSYRTPPSCTVHKEVYNSFMCPSNLKRHPLGDDPGVPEISKSSQLIGLGCCAVLAKSFLSLCAMYSRHQSWEGLRLLRLCKHTLIFQLGKVGEFLRIPKKLGIHFARLTIVPFREYTPPRDRTWNFFLLDSRTSRPKLLLVRQASLQPILLVRGHFYQWLD